MRGTGSRRRKSAGVPREPDGRERLTLADRERRIEDSVVQGVLRGV